MQTLADELGNSLLAEQGGMILLEGQTVDIVPVTAVRSGADVVLTFAFSGAASFTVNGTTRTSPWTDTGAANAPRTYTVLALDGGGNVIASGFWNYLAPRTNFLPALIEGGYLGRF